MGQTVYLWSQRSDAVSVTLFSAPIDVSSVRDATAFLNVTAAGTASVSIRADDTLDPNDPNGWSQVGSSVTVSAAGNGKTTIGGYSGGTTQPVGPFVRFVATVAVTSGAINWGAVAVLRA